MAKINLCDLEPGMVLAKDLRDGNGRFIVGKGTQLTARNLKILKAWGIIEADIRAMTQRTICARKTAMIDTKVLAVAEEQTQRRFAHTDMQHAAVRQLYHICVLREAGSIAGKASKSRSEKHDGMLISADWGLKSQDLQPVAGPEKPFEKKIKLPSVPVILSQLNEAICDPKCSATHIASIIGKDSSMSARLLKIVNSVFYNFPAQIDTISRAVAIIGTRQLSTLAFGAYALIAFKDVPAELMNMKTYWKHSIACGIIARIISSYKNDSNTERFFLAGLLHDIGRLIICKYFPMHARKALLSAMQTKQLLNTTEQDVLGFDHTQIGGLLLREWNLPSILEDCIRYHHSPTQKQITLDSAVIHLADVIANSFGIGSSGERMVPPLDAQAWKQVGLPTGMLNVISKQVDYHLAETVHLFYSDE